MKCLHCKVQHTKKPHRKYCSYQCGYGARRRIDTDLVRVYQARGMNSVQIAELIQSEPGAIRSAMSRESKRCKPLTASVTGFVLAPTPGSILTGSTA